MQLAVKKMYKLPSTTPCPEVAAMAKLSGANHVVQMYCSWSEKVSGRTYVYIAMKLFERYPLKL